MGTWLQVFDIAWWCDLIIADYVLKPRLGNILIPNQNQFLEVKPTIQIVATPMWDD